MTGLEAPHGTTGHDTAGGTGPTRREVIQLVDTWFRRLTDKAPVDEMLSLLEPGSLTMVFPEGSFIGEDGFRTWYAAVVGTFFDQVHDVRVLDVELLGEQADVHVAVDWQARTWQPPAAYSGWTGKHATQHWTVRRRDGTVVIADYRVVGFEDLAGPRRLPF